jgi:hypothetical protein
MERVLEEVEEAYDKVRSKYDEALTPLLKHDAQRYNYYYNKIRNKQVEYSGNLNIEYTTKNKEIKRTVAFPESTGLFINKTAVDSHLRIVGKEYEENDVKIPKELDELEESLENYVNTVDYLSKEIDLDDLRDLYEGDYTDEEKQLVTSVALQGTYFEDLNEEVVDLMDEMANLDNLQIVSSESYIVVRNDSNVSYVLGEDNSQEPSIFVHSVDDRRFIRNRIRDDKVREAIGFVKELKELNVHPNENAKYRIQGDLYFKRYTSNKTFDSVRKAYMTKDFISRIRTRMQASEIFRITFTEKGINLDVKPIRNDRIEMGLRNFVTASTARITNRGTMNIRDGIGRAKRNISYNIREKLEKTDKPTVIETKPPEVEMTNRGFPKMGDAETVERPARGREILDVVYDGEPEKIYLPIDNHLLIIEGAYVYPLEDDIEEEPVRLVIPEETNIQIWHEEHDNISTTIPKGVFEFGLLDRGEKVWEYNARQL